VVDPLSVPQLETEQDTVQLTPFVNESLVTAAVNACVLPSRTVEVAGETATLIGGGAELPQPEKMNPSARVSRRDSFFIEVSPPFLKMCLDKKQERRTTQDWKCPTLLTENKGVLRIQK
jgi:hypothetical protein